MDIKTHKDDLPSDLNLGKEVAIDTEAMGLEPKRDPLTLVQISTGNNDCHIIRLNRKEYTAKNLVKILEDEKINKIFHFARFDVAILKHTYKINIKNVYCTKIASKLARTYTDRHGYKDLCMELLNKSISKVEQSSDWGGGLTPEQQKYAATDVLYLHKIKNKLDKILEREGRIKLAQSCFNFIEHRTNMDLLGWADQDIFKH